MNKDTFYGIMLLIIFMAIGLYVWVMIAIGTYQLFGYGIFSTVIGCPIIIFNAYVYYIACVHVLEEYEKELERMDNRNK